MAVVTVVIADSQPIPIAWELPPGPIALRSPIPRGLLVYEGTAEIAIKGTSDQTSIIITTTVPSGFAYLPRNVMVQIESDDLVNDFNVDAIGFTQMARFSQVARFNMTSPGEAINGGTTAGKIYAPGRGAQKLILLDGDSMSFRFTDMSADASPAGDVRYFVEFYVFDVDQIDKWEINTPIPTISHTSF